jgi:CHAD domain-containing protein
MNTLLEKRNTQIAVGGIAAAGAAVAGGRAALAQRRARRDREWRRYRLRSGDEPAAEVKRIATARVQSALDHLREETANDPAPAIHEARKDLKKIRSLLRLVRDEVGDDLYRRENTRFRHAGRLLSGARDAQVKLETLAALRERFPEEASEGDWDRYTTALAGEAKPGSNLDDRIERAAREIEVGRMAVEGWPLRTNGWNLVGGGLRRGYRRGRRRFAEAGSEPSEENVHEWRKRAKDLWYHLRLLRESKPKRLRKEADRAHELSDLLGDHHDLAVLREDAGGRPRLLGAGGVELLAILAERRQEELLGDALSLGKRVYGEKPKAFAARFERYWEAWR